MSFYEELGVPQDASPDTIREVYRNVAKVLHPDAQRNPVLKECAEVQMKRINHLYEVLSDPEKRRKYDGELAAPPERPGPLIIHAPAPVERDARSRGGTWIWLAATAVCAGFVLWLATRDSTPPTVYPQPQAVIPANPTFRQKAPAGDRVRDAEMARLRAELANAYAERDRLARQLAGRFQPPPPRETQTPAPSVVTPAPLAAAVAPVDLGLPGLRPVAPPSRWTGSWVYSSRSENRNKSLAPPEFIETVLREENGDLRGRYRARFRVGDTRVSPEVDFQFQGRISGSVGRFSWTGAGGARGDVQLKLVSDSAMEVVWSATDLGRSMGLASGTAILNRRN